MARKNVANVSLIPEVDEPSTSIAVLSLGSKIKEKNAIAKERALAQQKAALQTDLDKIANHLLRDINRQIKAFLDAEDPMECHLFTSEYDAHPYCPAAVSAGTPKDFILAKANAEFAEVGVVQLVVVDNSLYMLSVEV